jgi:hypothetical protein
MRMPMREELYIPDGHPLDLARSSGGIWNRILNDPDFNVIASLLAMGISLSLYLTVHFPLPEDVCEMMMVMP